eukprot:m.48414 g.48414  ORF g.48414 m.48414 type:complete len:692 (+) comp10567_c0_seq2:102-2177(+)
MRPLDTVLLCVALALPHSAGSSVVQSQEWAAGHDGESLYFPEQDEPTVQSKINSGVCFPGGGSRAYTSALGALRALHMLKLLPKIRYMSGISGGSWAAASFTFRNTDLNVSEFLGEYLPPNKLTPEALNKMPPAGTMGASVPTLTQRAQSDHFANVQKPDLFAFGADYLKNLAEGNTQIVEDMKLDAIIYLASSGDVDFLKGIQDVGIDLKTAWAENVQNNFFETVGINNNSYVALNDAAVKRIKENNPNLQKAEFSTPTDGDAAPFLVLGGTIVGPAALAPLMPDVQVDSLTRLEMTPMYVGSALTRNVNFEGANKDVMNKTLGGFIETFAFGSAVNQTITESIPSGSSLSVEVPVPSTPFRISDASAISSAFFGAAFASKPSPIPEIVPHYHLMPVVENTPPVDMMVADGGVLENTGVISMLLRKVAHIVVFDCSEGTLEENSNLRSLFGKLNSSEAKGYGFDYSKNQVFPSNQYLSILYGLQRQLMKGKAAFYDMTVVTVENKWWGVEAGVHIHLTWIYNHAPKLWTEMLPQATREMMNGSQASLFKDFPHYPTSELYLNQIQTNLLSQLVTYEALTNVEDLKSGFGVYTGDDKMSSTTVAAPVTITPHMHATAHPDPEAKVKVKGDKTIVAMIGGIVAGVVVFIGVGIYILVLYHREQKRRKKLYSTLSNDELKYAGAVENKAWEPK